MKKLLAVIFCSLMAQGVYAADEGGFKKDAAAIAGLKMAGS